MLIFLSQVIGLMQVVAMMMKAGGAGLVLPYAHEFRNLIEEIGSSNVSQNAFIRLS